MTGIADADPIPRITLSAPEAGSGDVVAENIAALKALFPAIITDGRVDFDVLRQLLGDAVDDGEERYGLNWKGKRKARAFALTPTLATLRPAMTESKDWDSTQNIVIEGDNLEVLKCLRRSYAGQVKLIYIDPPYNTGNDFVYPDNYADSVGNYERLTGQRGNDGAAMTTNKEASGRFHTDWLNMMYPRLMLAKELLREDGSIFINIDDTELENVRRLMNEVFGEENFVANVLWQKKYAISADEQGVAPMHDHLVVYRRSSAFQRGLLPRTEEQDVRYANLDGDPRGRWASDNYVSNKSKDERPTLWYPITHPKDGREVWPASHAVWRYAKEKHEELEKDGRLYWGPEQSYDKPRMKRFLHEVQQGLVPSTWWTFQEVGHNDEAQKEVGELLGRKIFSTPKPVRLLDRVMTVANFEDGLVLDFFAGSGTTGHAAIAKNAVDGGKRRYILVQLPEPLDTENANQKAASDFCDTLGLQRNIAELTKERLRRAGAKIASENPGKVLDTGFRNYKLATSNLKPWAPDADNLGASLLDSVDNILPGRSEEDLLVELLLKTGIDLTLPMATREIAGRTVHALGGGVLIVCLGEVADADAEVLGQGIADWHAELDPVRATTFYFRDSGFKTAAAKANVAAIIRQRVNGRVERLASI
jgi:adenine-specific DNA-methyltransferase